MLKKAMVLLLMSKIALYLAQYFKEQLDVRHQHLMQEGLLYLIRNKSENPFRKIGAKFQ